MRFKTYIQSKLPFFVALSLLFVLASCGSYQYVGSDNDGIYNSSVEIPVEETPYVEATSSNNAYYKELFAKKSKQFETISQDDNVIFTDIESYEGNYSDEGADGEVVYEEGYAGWGQDNQDVNIHIYNNNWGWNTIGWGVGLGWYRPWGYRSAWGWNHWGYGGFYDPFWPNYGYGFYGPGFYAPYYGGYYGGYYGNYYNRNQVSYNSGRRGSVNAYNANRNSNVSRRGNSTLNSSRNSTITRRNSTTTRRNSTLNSNTTRRNNTINSRPTRRNTTINSSPTRRSTTTTRSSSPTRSSGGTMSSGSSRSSSSGGGRSSGGGGRRGG